MGLTLCGAVTIFSMQHFVLQNMLVGLRARISMIAAVYDKVTRLAVGNTASTGEIVNIVSNDVQRLEDAGTFANFIVTGSVESVVVLGLVWWQVRVVPLAQRRTPCGPRPTRASFQWSRCAPTDRLCRVVWLCGAHLLPAAGAGLLCEPIWAHP